MSKNTIPLVFDGRRYIIGGIQHEDAYGVVVFLDALGVKGIWQTTYPGKVLENWNKVYYMFSDKLNHHLSGVNLSAFSDTLIISIRGHKEMIDRPWRFVETVCEAIKPAFAKSMEYDFFFRGVITMGYYSRSSRILIGPAADEAANLYGTSEWIGICISPSTALHLETSGIITEPNHIVGYDIPQKNGGKMRWAINWTQSDNDGRCREILINKSNFYANKYNMHKDYEDYRTYIKYKNTLAFYDHCSRLE